MLETVMKHGIIFYVIGIMMAAGIITKVISYITTRKLVKAASDIQKSNQRFMRLIKAKFEHASMVSDRVQNVEAFVQKYLYEYKVLGVHLNSFRRFSLKMAWLIMVAGILGVLASYQNQGMTEQVFRYGGISAICAVVLISIHILSDEKIKLDAAKNYMVEYLENVCVHRYDKANKVMRATEEDSSAQVDSVGEEMEDAAMDAVEVEKIETINEEIKRVAEATKSIVTEQTVQEIRDELQIAEEEEHLKEQKEQEMRIRAILQEFLA